MNLPKPSRSFLIGVMIFSCSIFSIPSSQSQIFGSNYSDSGLPPDDPDYQTDIPKPYSYVDILKAREIALNDTRVIQVVGGNTYQLMPTGFAAYQSGSTVYPLVNINVANKTQVNALVDLHIRKVIAINIDSIRRSEPLTDIQAFAVKVNGQYYLVNYNLTNGAISTFSLDIPTKTLTFFVTTRENGNLILYLPRNLMNSTTSNDVDSKFIISVDGKQVQYEEVSKQGEKTRDLVIDMDKWSAHEVKVEGTEVVPEFGSLPVVIAGGVAAMLVISGKFGRASGTRYST